MHNATEEGRVLIFLLILKPDKGQRFPKKEAVPKRGHSHLINKQTLRCHCNKRKGKEDKIDGTCRVIKHPNTFCNRIQI